jgi:MFS family permease
MIDTLLIKKRVGKIFPALKHPNYRFYFSGQLVSLSGSWMQTVAQGWLVFQLTHSPFMVGLVSALQHMPILFFGVFGGVIVDRLNKQKLILLTQSASLFLALILGILTITGFINVWVVILFASLLGLINAIDTPARQSLIIEMVGREHLPSAIALNVGSFNSARVFGPALAGILIAKLGTGITFILNALTFLGPIIAIKSMKLNLITPPKTSQHPLAAVKQGLRYAYRHPIIKMVLVFAAVTSIFGWSYVSMLPVVAERAFKQDSFGLGLFYSSFGIGAVLGTVFISAFNNRFSVKKLLLGGSFLFTVSLFAFTLTTYFPLALIFLFFSGAGIAAQMALMQSIIQNNVENHLRGRVMSIFVTAHQGMLFIGNFQVGWIAELTGARTAIAIGAALIFVFAAYLYLTFTKLENIEYSAIT